MGNYDDIINLQNRRTSNSRSMMRSNRSSVALTMRLVDAVARCSLTRENLLYQLFGVNAELLIDHSWGWESCTMADVKAYRPESKSMGSGPQQAAVALLVQAGDADADGVRLDVFRPNIHGDFRQIWWKKGLSPTSWC